jgi:6-pyruvoyltetrahydropterin/6-carboxytetrahydropterin synthase
MARISAYRYHDISCGHRVYGHEGACANLHGHNYRVHFFCEAEQLDDLGRVIDFSVIKSKLCVWLDLNWDHKMLLWEKDPVQHTLKRAQEKGIVLLPFNPTAENLGAFLLNQIGPWVLPGKIKLTKVVVDETRKCSAVVEL